MPLAEAVSVRNRIFDALVAVCDVMTDEDGNRLWNKVVKGPVDQVTEQELPGLGVDPGNDKIELEDKFRTRKTFIVSFAFQWRRDPNAVIDNYEQFEYYLTKLIQALTVEDRLAGAINIREAGTGPEIEGRNDPRPGGYLLMEVCYQHRRTDPSQPPCGL